MPPRGQPIEDEKEAGTRVCPLHVFYWSYKEIPFLLQCDGLYPDGLFCQPPEAISPSFVFRQMGVGSMEFQALPGPEAKGRNAQKP